MTTDDTDALRMLPDDWWQRVGACFVLRNWFERHVVGLHIGFLHNDEPMDEIFSGFLLEHHGYYFWITAGHVIRLMRQLMSDPEVEIDHADWMEHAPPSLGGSLPVDIRDLTTGFLDPDGLDFGFVLLSPGYALPLLKNPNIQFVDERIWFNHENACPEGYLLLGYPFEWFCITGRFMDGAERRRRISQGVACLPMERVEDLGEAANEGLDRFWGHAECLYGRLLPHLGSATQVVDDIRGMSGGPILSVERDPSGRIRYRLFGVQSSWLRSSRTVRAGRIDAIAAVLNQFVAELETTVASA